MITECNLLNGFVVVVMTDEQQHVWTEIRETQAHKDRMLMKLERVCLEIYRRKVDETTNAKACLYQYLLQLLEKFAGD